MQKAIHLPTKEETARAVEELRKYYVIDSQEGGSQVEPLVLAVEMFYSIGLDGDGKTAVLSSILYGMCIGLHTAEQREKAVVQ